MRAAVYHGRRDVRIEDVPQPQEPGAGEVILAVHWCGICGTDLEEYLYGPSIIPREPHPLTGRMIPIVLGHEFMGELVSLGKDVEGLSPGTRVASEVVLFCGSCFWCRHHEYGLCERGGTIGFHQDGGLAEYVKVPAQFCFPIDNELSEVGALVEPVAVTVRALRRGRFKMGEHLVILGGGPIGLCLVQVARASGARMIILVEPRATRREVGLRLGASMVLDPADSHFREQYLDITNGMGADLTVECTGNQAAIPLALDLTRKGGRAVVLGVHHAPAQIDTLGFVLGEKELIGSVAHNYDDDFATAVALINSKRLKLEPLVTRRVPLEAVVSDGFEALADLATREIKIMVQL